MADTPVTPSNTEGKVDEVKTIDVAKTAALLFDNKTSDTKTEETKTAEIKAAADAKAKTDADAKALADAEAAKKTKEGDPAKVEDVKDDKAKTEEAPIEYKDFTLPEGFEVDADVSKSFKEAAKELKLTQEQAQKLVDMQTSLATKQSKVAQEQWAGVQKDWREKAQSDKEFGGKEFQANIGVAKKALEKYGTKEFKDAIESTGMGNHPELIRFLYKVGKSISEDKIMSEGDKGQAPREHAKILYPGMN